MDHIRSAKPQAANDVVFRSNVTGYPRREGKVRDVYDLGDRLAIVASDRISAFDWIMPTPIPGKGILLTAMTRFWFDWLKVPNHSVCSHLAPRDGSENISRSEMTTNEVLPAAFAPYADRTMLVRKATVVPFECVARGYLAGSGWKEYQQSGTVCGIKLPAGLRESEQLPEPIFTPATKAESGHDENVSYEVMAKSIGEPLARELKERTLDVYRRASAYAGERGIILADTKFEWGTLPTGEVILIDEVLTPDSSRFWPKETYRVGESPASYDKQYLRNWLESVKWDKSSPPPELPDEVVEKTAAKYREAMTRLTGKR